MNFPISIKLAVRNIFRNKIRTLITLAAIAFGSVSIIIAGGFFEDTFMQMREAVIHSHLGHIQIYSKGYNDHGSSAPFDYLIEEPNTVTEKIVPLDHVKLITPRISFSGMISTGDNTVSVFCQGVDPEGELILNKIENIKDASTGLAIQEGSNLTKNDRFDMILGRGLAKNIGAKPGDSLVLLTNTVGGSLNAFDMNVKGVFFTASKEFDDRALRLPIDMAQKLIRTEGVQTLVVLLDQTENTLAVKEQILKTIWSMDTELEIRVWSQLADFYNKTVELYGRQFFILKLIITIIVILSIFNTINMAIWERTREIGTIMAMGYKKIDIMKLFLAEGFILGLLGGITGIIAGTILAWIISFFGIPMPPPPGATVGWTAFIKVVPGLLGSSMIISVSASVVSSFYPAFKASNLVITDALRHY
ncbi:ABC transporter permease [Desulfobacula phenolica]|uniref:Putative ABC transport system permease protein n=1 Tax=Desulfobacula phenolica TaxID=90732 RepID=A0A1H2EQ87_9BACT|nr:FtsX-like permease family protein [Desulfobacula phenolica]SDT97251.1 putative ABC transport system permease protein [Desulfobacula phenolica]